MKDGRERRPGPSRTVGSPGDKPGAATVPEGHSGSDAGERADLLGKPPERRGTLPEWRFWQCGVKRIRHAAVSVCAPCLREFVEALEVEVQTL